MTQEHNDVRIKQSVRLLDLNENTEFLKIFHKTKFEQVW